MMFSGDETLELLKIHRPRLAEEWEALANQPLWQVDDWLEKNFPGVVDGTTVCQHVPDLLAKYFEAQA